MFSILIFMSSWNFMLSWFEFEFLYNLWFRPKGYKTFSNSAQLSMNFILLINVKLPTIIMHTWVEGKRKHLNPIVLATVTTWNHEVKKGGAVVEFFFCLLTQNTQEWPMQWSGYTAWR